VIVVLAVDQTRTFRGRTLEVVYLVCFYCVGSAAEIARLLKRRDVTPGHGPSIVAGVHELCSPGIDLVLQDVHFLLPSV